MKRNTRKQYRKTNISKLPQHQHLNEPVQGLPDTVVRAIKRAA